MEQLTDDALLLVLRLLPIKDLINLRLVCKRLRDLALHPYAWSHRTLSSDRINPPLFNVVLRIAPCIRLLSIRSDCNESAAALLKSTTCGAQQLFIAPSNIYLRTKLNLDLVAILKRQRELGRLQTLDLNLSGLEGSSTSGGRLTRLIQEIHCFNNLEDLTVFLEETDHIMIPIENLIHDDVKRPTLKKLHYDLTADGPYQSEDNFFDYLITRHAETLREVSVLKTTISHDFFWLIPVTTPFGLLAALPNLEKLETFVQIGMEIFVQCQLLHSLVLQIRWTARNHDRDHSHLRGLRDTELFLRKAEHLRKVKLLYWAEGEPEGEPEPEQEEVEKGRREAELILSLSSSRSKLEYLELQMLDDRSTLHETPSFLPSLVRALPSLPHLVVLVVQSLVNFDFLSAITPVSVPNLKQLIVSINDCCYHNIMHHAEVQGLLHRYPNLHLGLVEPQPYFIKMCASYDTEEETDKYCHKDCHDIGLYRYQGFYTHDGKCHQHGLIYGCGPDCDYDSLRHAEMCPATCFTWEKFDLRNEIEVDDAEFEVEDEAVDLVFDIVDEVADVIEAVDGVVDAVVGAFENVQRETLW